MSATCPACNDENVQLLSKSCGTGGSGVEAETAGAAGAHDIPPETISRRAAPPAKASYLRIVIFWFVATFAAPFLVLMLHLPQTAGKYISYGISIFTACAVLGAYTYNKIRWPALFETWQHSYICLHCGKIFH